MARFEAKVLGVPSSRLACEQLAGARRDQVVLFAVDIEQRHGAIFQIDPVSPDFHPALNQQILLVTILDKLPNGFAGNVRTVEDPLFHSYEVFDELLIVHVFKKTDVLIDHQPRGIEEQKTQIEQVPRHVAIRLYYSPQIHFLGPDMQKPLVGLEIARRHGGNEVLYLFRMQGPA